MHSVGRSVVSRVGLGVEVGDFIVSTKVSNDESDNENGKDGLVCCEVYSVEATARARQVTLRALGPVDVICEFSHHLLTTQSNNCVTLLLTAS